MNRKKIAIIAITVAVTFIIAIGIKFIFTPQKNEAFSEAALKIKVEQLWKARLNRDKKAVYAMVDGAYKKNVSEEQFLKKGDYQITGTYEIKEIKINPQKETATATVKFKTMQMGYVLEPTILENWLFENGEWHVGYSMRKNPFMPNPNQ